jgi:hypothetical protein
MKNYCLECSNRFIVAFTISGIPEKLKRSKAQNFIRFILCPILIGLKGNKGPYVKMNNIKFSHNLDLSLNYV